MRNLVNAAMCMTLTLIVLLSTSQGIGSQVAPNDCAWIERTLKDIRSVKVGMTRSQLESTFTTEGGLSSRRSRTYTYRSCPYIKVDVQFQAIQHATEKLKEFPDDKIVGMSKPYIENRIID